MVIDTNIIIAYLKGEERIVSALDDWKGESRTLFVSSVTYSEVLSYPTINPEEIDEARSFLSTFIAVPFDNEIGETAAYLRRVYRLALPDAAIAATSIKYSVPLVTRDRGLHIVKEIQIVEM